jgi:hypothetical protein
VIVPITARTDESCRATDCDIAGPARYQQLPIQAKEASRVADRSLDPKYREVAAYQLGWWDSEGPA